MAAHERQTGRRVGVKVSGGVRTVDQAVEYLDLADAAWGADAVSAATFRFGASSLLDDVFDRISADDDRAR